ncbi:MAG: extracellular solute-binding protein [Lachnospiraceae bacterium]|nr:extracellular solute-binding protein [Lachnospiraceae bacterium]
MKKKVLSLILASAMVISLAACGSSSNDSSAATAPDTSSTETTTAADTTSTDTASTDTAADTATEEEAAPASELTDGKFAETRHITVEVYDRGNDNGSDPTNNMYTEFIKKGMMDQHNVEVEFVAVPRWTEVDDINNLLAAGDAPDICVTYSYPTVLSYAQMGGIIDLKDYVEEYKADTQNLWNWLGDTNMLWDKDPKTGSLWAIEGKRAEQERIVTFVRQDWLDTLGLKTPTTRQEFEDMLIAFRDNADTLLGKDASKMVPFSVSKDIGWRTANLLASFLDPNISDREFYINGFDDRLVTQTSTKEAVRLLNKWYNDGLIRKDFAIYDDDTAEDDMIKSGYVGAFMHNWDMPFRNGEDSYNSNLRRLVGENAKFVAIDPFENAAGKHAKFLYSSAGDRKIFFPTTNDEVLASFLYLDFISDPATIKYLQAGDEGVTHEVLDSGAIQIIAAEGDAIQNSGKNIDYTITCNGTYFGDTALADLSRAYGYADQDPELVSQADKISLTDGIAPINVNVGEISAEAGVGDTLSSKRDQIYDNAVVAPVADFDSTWDSFMDDYLSSGGQDIMDERAAKWEEYFGDADMLP